MSFFQKLCERSWCFIFIVTFCVVSKGAVRFEIHPERGIEALQSQRMQVTRSSATNVEPPVICRNRIREEYNYNS